MPVSAAYESKLTVTETLADTFLNTNSKSVKYDGMNTALTLDANSSPAVVTKSAAFEKAMSSGAGTIDFRALVGTNGGAIDGNGLKVQAIKLINKANNANAITIVPGASNGLNLFGAAFSITLSPGQEITAYFKEQGTDIDATHKTIDISGTGSQVLQVIVVMG